MTRPVFCPNCGIHVTHVQRSIKSYRIICTNCDSVLTATDQTDQYREEYFSTVKELRKCVDLTFLLYRVIDLWKAETT